jgi:hypothetical protein
MVDETVCAAEEIQQQAIEIEPHERQSAWTVTASRQLALIVRDRLVELDPVHHYEKPRLLIEVRRSELFHCAQRRFGLAITQATDNMERVVHMGCKVHDDLRIVALNFTHCELVMSRTR